MDFFRLCGFGGADLDQDSVVNFRAFALFDPPMAGCIEIHTQ